MAGQARVDEWLMQPRWLPTLRRGIGIAVGLVALVGLIAAWPWAWVEVALLVVWGAYASFLVWASRYEHSGTRLTPEAIELTSGRRTRVLTRADILDIRGDQPPPHTWRVQAVLDSGETVTLLGVPPGELARLRAWHLGAGPGQSGGSRPRS